MLLAPGGEGDERNGYADGDQRRGQGQGGSAPASQGAAADRMERGHVLPRVAGREVRPWMDRVAELGAGTVVCAGCRALAAW